ncbi:hypothetical protein [Edaphobacter flagellatus]|uniref:hypothetical protein n=1 Tax=Edaphobacter flagellatus TaxID=1933044 RepID=UPI0021B32F69|nr:hypothetical protein [Edaphobacter flagellatus]
MNDLNQALGDISRIRRQVAATTEFRGYGPATLAATGGMAMLAALAQRFVIANPAAHLAVYLQLWITTAILAMALTGTQMFTRSRRIHSALSDDMIRMAVEQFLPALGAGSLLTLVLFFYVPQSAWMLPGLWQIVFGLGIFASGRFLPKLIFVAGAWYLFTGLAVIAVGVENAFSPIAMGVPFGVGQLLVAAILFYSNRSAADEV